MFEKLEIKKTKDEVTLFVRLKKWISPKDTHVNFSWKDAKKLIQEKHPDLKIDKPKQMKKVLSNKRSKVLEEEWSFVIQKPKEAKKVTKKEAPPAPKKRIQATKRKTQKTKKLVDTLTKPKEPATVVETSQSDQPAIVQEPTE